MSKKLADFDIPIKTPCPTNDSAQFQRFKTGHPISFSQASTGRTIVVLNPYQDKTKLRYACGLCLTQAANVVALVTHYHRCSDLQLQKLNTDYVNKYLIRSLRPPLQSCKTTLLANSQVADAKALPTPMDGYNHLQAILRARLTPEQRAAMDMKDKLDKQKKALDEREKKLDVQEKRIKQLEEELLEEGNLKPCADSPEGSDAEPVPIALPAKAAKKVPRKRKTKTKKVTKCVPAGTTVIKTSTRSTRVRKATQYLHDI